MAAGQRGYDPDTVGKRGQLLQSANPHVITHRVARNMVALEEPPGHAQSEVRFGPWWQHGARADSGTSRRYLRWQWRAAREHHFYSRPPHCPNRHRIGFLRAGSVDT